MLDERHLFGYVPDSSMRRSWSTITSFSSELSRQNSLMESWSTSLPSLRYYLACSTFRAYTYPLLIGKIPKLSILAVLHLPIANKYHIPSSSPLSPPVPNPEPRVKLHIISYHTIPYYKTPSPLSLNTNINMTSSLSLPLFPSP